jgi:phenylalanyl-tRNA synthetase beta chain
MPSISVNYNDICRLLGKKLGPDELRDRLRMLGVDGEIVDEELKLEITHNRPDLLSPEGLARSLKGFLGIETGLPSYAVAPSKIVVEIDESVRPIRPYIVAGVVKDIELTDDIVASLMQVQEKLHASLCRNRRRGSIGVYDLDKVVSPISYTSVQPDGTSFVPLEFNREMSPAQILQEHPKGVEYAHLLQGFPRYPLLVDSMGTVLSMPPIINSEDTRVTGETKNLFIDVTGTDERTVGQALDVMMTGLAERGLKLYSVTVRYLKKSIRTPSLKPKQRRLDVARTNDFIGLNLKPAAMVKITKRMRYGVRKMKKNHLTVLVPSYRTDIMHEVDLMEDIAIGYGYDRLKPTVPAVVTAGEPMKIEKTSEKARLVLTGLGFMETMGYSLTTERRNSVVCTDEKAVEIANPVSEGCTIVRNCLLPSLLSALYENRRHPTPQKLFEVGDVAVLDSETETGARNSRRVAAAISGREATFTQIKAVAEALLRELGINAEARPSQHPSFLTGRAVEFMAGKKIGIAGEINPEIILSSGLEHPVAAFEIKLE